MTPHGCTYILYVVVTLYYTHTPIIIYIVRWLGIYTMSLDTNWDPIILDSGACIGHILVVPILRCHCSYHVWSTDFVCDHRSEASSSWCIHSYQSLPRRILDISGHTELGPHIQYARMIRPGFSYGLTYIDAVYILVYRFYVYYIWTYNVTYI